MAEHRPALEAALTVFNDALEGRKLAAKQLAEARAQEDGAIEAWISAYAGNAGAIQAIFKRRRAERELYFDRFRHSSSAEAEDEVDDGGDDRDGPVDDA